MIEKRNFFQTQKIKTEALISPNKMEVLPGPLPDGRRSGGDGGLGLRLTSTDDAVAMEIENGRLEEEASLKEENKLPSSSFPTAHASRVGAAPLDSDNGVYS